MARARGWACVRSPASSGGIPRRFRGVAPQRLDPNLRLDYKASIAQWHAERRDRRPKAAKLLAKAGCEIRPAALAGEVRTPTADGHRTPGPAVEGPEQAPPGRSGLGRRWSPEQISSRLRAEFPEDESMRISHEAIYQALYVQGRGALKRELVACLRTGRALRVPRARSKQKAGRTSPRILISERPAEAEDRAVPGHWEGDLIIGCSARRSGHWSSGRPGSRCWSTCLVRMAGA